ncbi:hypothetical protein Bca52824_079511 [Brassica carinata]|uniref:Sugar phosphate transporter domain-containing protein n=1 Tax=Brassica carinata TaxID=52824 RepID=A0A8X7Q0E4_BRACI|nr:hypothetical protein Bca52824_079511 [Brassica carinata]
MSEGQKFQLGTIGALSLSVVSSVSIVICNKALISTLGFTFAFDPRAVMGFGILNGISIGLLNLSLGFNSLMTRFFVLLQSKIQFSLTILLLGVGIATVTDLQLNMLGSVLSLLAVITTCVAQIMTNTIQKKFKVSSTQLLYQSCPYQAITLFTLSTRDFTQIICFRHVFTRASLFTAVFIVLSCMISVSVNFSTFLVIGKTSPVTYQVLGHLKTCLVLAFGYVLLKDPFNWRNILGIMVAVIGMVVYSYFCSVETQQKASETSTQLPQMKESEKDPLIAAENGSGLLSDGGGVGGGVGVQKTAAPVWNSNKDFQA